MFTVAAFLPPATPAATPEKRPPSGGSPPPRATHRGLVEVLNHCSQKIPSPCHTGAPSCGHQPWPSGSVMRRRCRIFRVWRGQPARFEGVRRLPDFRDSAPARASAMPACGIRPDFQRQGRVTGLSGLLAGTAGQGRHGTPGARLCRASAGKHEAAGKHDGHEPARNTNLPGTQKTSRRVRRILP